MKLRKPIMTAAFVLATVAGLTACGGAAGPEQYVVNGYYGQQEVSNLKRTLTLIDEDTYTLTVVALDSKDLVTRTMDLYMSGAYTRVENTVTIEPGYGNCKAMNGSTPIQMPITPDGQTMYAMAMETQSYVFEVGDGTFTMVE